VELFKTDIGNLTNNNLMYLIGQGILVKEGSNFFINAREIKVTDRQRVKLWSLFCLTFEETKSKMGNKRLNSVLKYMRNSIEQVDRYGLKILSTKKNNSKFDTDWSELG